MDIHIREIGSVKVVEIAGNIDAMTAPIAQ